MQSPTEGKKKQSKITDMFKRTTEINNNCVTKTMEKKSTTYHVLQPLPKEFNCVVKLERKDFSHIKMEPEYTEIKMEREDTEIEMELEDSETDMEQENAPPPKKKKPIKKVPKVPKEEKLPKLSAFEQKRLQNLRDNQEMLAKLLDDLRKDLGDAPFLPKGKGRQSGPKPTAPKPAAPKKRKSAEPFQVRRNPSRCARDGRNSTGSSGASSPSGGLMLGFDFMKRSPFYEESSDEENDREIIRKRSRRSWENNHRTIERDMRGPDEITQEDLDNVADSSTGKVYNQATGTSCHQCRQKTIDQKTICRGEECWGVRGQFCGPCLRNRYGEDVKEALKDAEWTCPPCRGICNCSFCRAKAGKACTGILIHLAREHGYNDVNSFLQSFRGGKK